MIVNTLALVLITIFVALALVHVYWAFGGTGGRAAAIPMASARPLFRPSRWSTLVVAFALLVAAVVIAGVSGWLGRAVPHNMFRLLTLGVSLVFFVRAIGDFHYVGFFRRVSGSSFAYWDLRLYSPLCLLIAGLALALLYVQVKSPPLWNRVR